MALQKSEREEIIEEFQVHDKDTGSSEVQIALLSERIAVLTDHLRENPHDHHSRRGLFKMVGRRRRLLRYLAKNDARSYQSLIERLGLRR